MLIKNLIESLSDWSPEAHVPKALAVQYLFSDKARIEKLIREINAKLELGGFIQMHDLAGNLIYDADNDLRTEKSVLENRLLNIEQEINQQ